MATRRLLRLASPFLLTSALLAQDLQELQPGSPGCARWLRDSVTGLCLEASSVPGPGRLIPDSPDLNRHPSTGWVGVGRELPQARLHVEEHATTYAALIDQHAPNSIGLGVLLDDDTPGLSIGILARTLDQTGTALVVGTGGVLVSGGGTAVTATSSVTSGPPVASILGFAPAGLRADTGVLGITSSQTGGNGVEGVHGEPTGTGAGVHGTTNSLSSMAAGTVGVVEDPAAASYSAGVRGIHHGTGGAGIGVWGSHDGSGWGVHGEVQGPGIGVYGKAGANGTGLWGQGGGAGFGVFSAGDMGTTGAKAFVQPHPTDASREIRFVCLEGNESGTYFRGSSVLVDGRAVIEVPEDFRMVTEEDALTVQVTANGPVLLWVESKDLDHVVVRGERDVAFDYFVNGVRRGFAGFETLRENQAFVPRERGVPFGTELPEGVRELLIQNGTLRADGTPNEATAHRLGWELEEPRGPRPVRAAARPVLVPADGRRGVDGR